MEPIYCPESLVQRNQSKLSGKCHEGIECKREIDNLQVGS
jgi:hypothetical protein